MRSLALVLGLLLTGCVPGYWVHPNDLRSAEVAAQREGDGSAVTLQGGSFRPTSEPPRSDGSVRVRGPGRHGQAWLAGLLVTTIGLGISATGGMLFGLSGIQGIGYSGSYSDGTGHSSSLGTAMFAGGLTLLGVGGLASALIGPSIWIAGARQAPIELR